MKKNFFTSMLSEGGKISHKRFISLLVTAVICILATVVAFKHPAYITDTLHSLLVFVAVMSGVATVPQIVALFRGTSLNKKEEDEKTT